MVADLIVVEEELSRVAHSELDRAGRLRASLLRLAALHEDIFGSGAICSADVRSGLEYRASVLRRTAEELPVALAELSGTVERLVAGAAALDTLGDDG